MLEPQHSLGIWPADLGSFNAKAGPVSAATGLSAVTWAGHIFCPTREPLHCLRPRWQKWFSTSWATAFGGRVLKALCRMHSSVSSLRSSKEMPSPEEAKGHVASRSARVVSSRCLAAASGIAGFVVCSIVVEPKTHCCAVAPLSAFALPLCSAMIMGQGRGAGARL